MRLTMKSIYFLENSVLILALRENRQLCGVVDF